MRVIICTVLLSCSILATAQDTTISYTRVMSADTLSKAAIYERIKLWSVNLFEKTKGVLQVDDKESGIMAFDASADMLSPNAPKIEKKSQEYKLQQWYHSYTFKIKIQIRDGRYKADLTDIKMKFADGNYYELTSTTKAPFKYMFSKPTVANTEWEDSKLTFGVLAEGLFNSLQKSVSRKDDW